MLLENWFFLALLGPLFWTISDFIDKLVIDNHVTSTVDFLFTFSLTSWFCLALLIFIFGVPAPSVNAVFAIALGFSTTLSFYFYALGLKHMDTSLAILTFKLVPILAILLAFLIFSAPLKLNEIAAALIVAAGALYLFVELDEGQFTWNKGMPWMLLAVCMWAVIFVVADHLLNTMTFGEYMVLDTFGASLVTLPLLCFPRTLKDVVHGIKSARKNKYRWFFLNTFTDFLAQVCLKKSFSLAPTVGAVSLVTQIQSVYGIIAGVLLTVCWPSVFSENISKENITKKIIGSVIIASGIAIALI